MQNQRVVSLSLILAVYPPMSPLNHSSKLSPAVFHSCQKKKRLCSPYFPAPLLPVCKHAQDESLRNYIPIACILPLALPFHCFHAHLPIKPNIWGLVLCWGSLTPGKAFSSSLGDTQEPPAHVTVLEGRLSTALQVHHPVICLEKLIPALGSWPHCSFELVSEAREEFTWLSNCAQGGTSQGGAGGADFQGQWWVAGLWLYCSIL